CGRESYILQAVNRTDIVDVLPGCTMVDGSSYSGRRACIGECEVKASGVIDTYRRIVARTYIGRNSRGSSVLHWMHRPGNAVILRNNDCLNVITGAVGNVNSPVHGRNLNMAVQATARQEGRHGNGR